MQILLLQTCVDLRRLVSRLVRAFCTKITENKHNIFKLGTYLVRGGIGFSVLNLVGLAVIIIIILRTNIECSFSRETDVSFFVSQITI